MREKRKDSVGEYSAKIDNDVRITIIYCKLSNYSYIMDKDTNAIYKRDVIYSFSRNKSPESWFTNFFIRTDYYKTHDKELKEIVIEVTNQKINIIGFNGEKCSFT